MLGRGGGLKGGDVELTLNLLYNTSAPSIREQIKRISQYVINPAVKQQFTYPPVNRINDQPK